MTTSETIEGTADEVGTEPPKPSLLTSLLAVQAETPTLAKDAQNPHFRSKYTPLDTIVETLRPILARHELVWITLPSRDDHGEPSLKYRLVHATTGEILDGEMPLLLTKADPQGFGSALTYARRYALCAVLNLVSGDDDDGNAAAAAAAAAPRRRQTRRSQPPATSDVTPDVDRVVALAHEALEAQALSAEDLKGLLGKYAPFEFSSVRDAAVTFSQEDADKVAGQLADLVAAKS